MKRVIILIICLLLTGCASFNEIYLNEDLDNFLNDLSFSYKKRPNHVTDYYDYYLPSDMQEIDGNYNSSILTFNGSKVAMNVNVTSIINSSKYYSVKFCLDGFFNDANLVYTKEDTFNMDNFDIVMYHLDVYKSGKYYLLNLTTSNLIFYASCEYNNLVNLLKRLFIIAKSVDVDRKAIVSAYSTEDIIDYNRKQIDLFEYVIPNEGYLSDLVDYTNGTSNPSN